MDSLQKYSVLMSLYSGEAPEFFDEALGSMTCQTVLPDQIVIVKDGPVGSGLDAVLEKYMQASSVEFTIVSNDENRGLGFSLNRGLAVCRNELVARMDTDDVSLPERCEMQLAKFTLDPSLDIVGSNVDEFEGEIGNVVSTRRVPENQSQIYSFAKRRSAFNHPTVMYKKSSVLRCGGYRDLRRNQDVDLFGRMLYAGCTAYNIQKSLVLFRVGDNLSHRRKSWENTRSYIEVIQNLHDVGYSSWIDVLAVSTLQLCVFLVPVSVQSLLYRVFLRR